MSSRDDLPEGLEDFEARLRRLRPAPAVRRPTLADTPPRTVAPWTAWSLVGSLAASVLVGLGWLATRPDPAPVGRTQPVRTSVFTLPADASAPTYWACRRAADRSPADLEAYLEGLPRPAWDAAAPTPRFGDLP